MKKVKIYKGYERFWHWSQAALIIFLAFTGFEIHASYEFFGFEHAVLFHNYAAKMFIVLIVFTIFWHFTTGEWKQYIPTTRNMKAYINYYLTGIFKGAPHPTHKTLLSRLNPLQRLVYFGLKVLVIPVMVFSGIAYLFFRYPQNNNIEGINIEELEYIAIVHTMGAFILISFLIVHLYLITTGTTITSNLNAMLTGYEEIEENKQSQPVDTP